MAPTPTTPGNPEDPSSSARRLLREVFGFESFRDGQSAVIGHLLEGRSAAAVFPTGGGKSLCYQLPALLLPGLTLVVSPLIALMKDQIDQLRARGVAAARLDSTLDADGYRALMDDLRGHRLRLLYVAPERFANERFREVLATLDLDLFAVDEAHCISEWGHNFRPDYLKLAGFARDFGARRVLALTATAPPTVLDDICTGFAIDPECAVRTGFYRPNLTLLTTPCAREERDDALITRLRDRPPGATIVYVTLQKTAEAVAARLEGAGFPARAYHAGMKDEARTTVQDWFVGSSNAIVVATIAFGMGIDKANIRYVYHRNLPKSLENLAQEIGRAGRDGKPAICELLVSPEDRTTLERFAYGDTPSAEAVHGLLGELLAGDDVLELSLYHLGQRHDIKLLVVRTLLTYLELGGHLQALTPTFTRYRFQPLASSQAILEQFDGERRQFLHDLLRQAKKARTWFDIDLQAAADALGQPRSRLVRALDYLAERQLLHVTSAGLQHRYRWRERPGDPEAVASTLYQRMIERERREVDRIDQVLALITHAGCRTGLLSAHFGEPRDEACGHCSWCLQDGESTILPPYRPPSIDDATWHQLEDLRDEHRSILGPPRALARFAAGLTSPAISRARLGKHALFGALTGVPFGALVARAGGDPTDPNHLPATDTQSS